MTVIIVGADDVGRRLVELAVEDGIDLVVIEEDPERAETVRAEYDCTVINDDPASLQTLEEAGGEGADALVASTSNDAVNITTCLFGQQLGIDTTASIINNAEHGRLFEQFGIETVGNPYRLVAEQFYSSVVHPSIVDRRIFRGNTEILEIRVSENSSIANRTISEAVSSRILGDDVTVISVHQERLESRSTVPNGDTRIKAGDHVTLITPSGTWSRVAEAFE
ncbi:potassium channel family protein [Halopelagius fulvigenes]|uniref:Potassium channel family protein n=1 Tax=Halopelagius fulvigenes TaxID=1198324 RepID=A0ABD5TT63_9EURY